jgi:hypothetical protein
MDQCSAIRQTKPVESIESSSFVKWPNASAMAEPVMRPSTSLQPREGKGEDAPADPGMLSELIGSRTIQLNCSAGLHKDAASFRDSD